jgi:putative membrane protein
MNRIAFACAALLVTFAPRAWAADAAPSDAQIAAIVVAANQADIDAGNLARERSKTKEVQDLAVRMVTDHTGVNKQASDLVTKLHVTPESNPTSESLKKGGEDNVTALKKLSGAAFDKAYVDHEVAYHESVIGVIDKTLIPSAKNAELKALLEQSRPVFESHLEHAKSLQASLAKSGG